MSELTNFIANIGGDIIAQVVASVILIGITFVFNVTRKKKAKVIILSVLVISTVLAIIFIGTNYLRKNEITNHDNALTITLEHNSVVIQDGSVLSIQKGDVLRVNVQAAIYNMVQVGWSWDQQKDLNKSENGVASVVIPVEHYLDGNVHQLQIEAIVNDEINEIISNSNIITVRVVGYESQP